MNRFLNEGMTAGFLRQRFSNSGSHSRHGDDDLNPGVALPLALKAAAVLVPIVLREDGLTVLLTRRTDHLAAHAGQISFPGGRIEADETPIAAALREAHEEINLDPGKVEILGTLAHYVTGTGYTVTPIVGLVQPPLDLVAHEHEVADIFEVPLAFLMDDANREMAMREFQGVARQFYAFSYPPDRYIWGATAGMLVALIEFLKS